MIDAVIEELKTHQTQLDQDGVMVGVSRQALEELLAHVAAPAHPAPIAGLEPVAWQLRYAGSNHPWVNAEKVNTGSDIEWRGLVPVAQAEAHAAEQVRAERERIAAWHDEQARNFRLADTEHDNIEAFAHELSAAAIRARGQV